MAMNSAPFLCPCCGKWKLYRGADKDEICDRCDGSGDDWMFAAPKDESEEEEASNED